MRLLAVLLALALGLPTAARTRAVSGRIDAARRILVVTAHPDDELLLAPLLGDRCARDGISCAIVVMTTGNFIPEMGDVRAAEMARAAALLNLRLTQWTFSDVLANVDAVWSAEAGDHATLVRMLGDVIAIEQPDLILTFDPEHGSTGHEAHRETGALVLETGARNIMQLETRAEGFTLSSATPRASVYNGDWNWVVRIAETHASQFTPEQVDILRNLPLAQRRVWLAEDRVVR